MTKLIDFIASYSLVDFMPMGVDIYLRLFERLNVFIWPWQGLTVAMGVLIVWLTHRQKLLAWPLLGALWIFSGVVFHGHYFAELNWAAVYYKWAFIAQGLILSTVYFQTNNNVDRRGNRLASIFGSVIIALALIGFPLWSSQLGNTWLHVQVIGLAPDPTCLFTFGVMLISRQKHRWAAIVPIIWSLISTCMAYALDLPMSYTLIGCAVMFMLLNSSRHTARNRF